MQSHVSYKKEAEGDRCITATCRGEGHVRLSKEMQPQLRMATRSWKGQEFSLESQRRHGPAYILILELWLPELRREHIPVASFTLWQGSHRKLIYNLKKNSVYIFKNFKNKNTIPFLLKSPLIYLISRV